VFGEAADTRAAGMKALEHDYSDDDWCEGLSAGTQIMRTQIRGPAIGPDRPRKTAHAWPARQMILVVKLPQAALPCIFGVILKGRSRPMEVQFTPEVQAKLDQMARDAGRQPAEVIEDAVVGLYDELAYTREMLNRRYDEMESGKAPGIDGEEAYRRLMEKTRARRQSPA
jgi:hypothetical protein